MQEAVPLRRELLPQVKQAQRRRCPILTVTEVRLEMRYCAVLNGPESSRAVYFTCRMASVMVP